jgi:hypothetical protein
MRLWVPDYSSSLFSLDKADIVPAPALNPVLSAMSVFHYEAVCEFSFTGIGLVILRFGLMIMTV